MTNHKEPFDWYREVEKRKTPQSAECVGAVDNPKHSIRKNMLCHLTKLVVCRNTNL